jgi:hypothetical protein
MRKVLLATTAIVALGGVSAASADISISGGHELKYQSWNNSTSTSANNSKISSGATYTISGSTVLDNGMTISGKIYSDNVADGSGFESQGFSISDDWGTIGVADMESGDAFATAIDITDDEAYDGGAASTINTYAPGDEYVQNSSVSYLSPNISGFQFAIGMKDTGAYSDATSYGAQYAMSAGDAAVTVKYAASSTGDTTSGAADEIDATSAALVIGMSGATLTVAQNTADVGTTAEYESSGMALAYVVSDALTVEAYSGETENNLDSDYKFKDTGYGITYTVTPGMAVSVTHNSWDYTSNAAASDDGTNTAVAVNVSF